MRRTLYIAYGSNLNIEQMKFRCPDAKKIGAAVIEDYQLNFRGTRRGSGVANIEKCKGSSVPVGIWAVSERDEENLDWYEGFPLLYIKKYLQFYFDGKMQYGLAYVMRPGHPSLEPAVDYENKIRVGYENFGIKTKALDEAIANCKYQKKQEAMWRKYLEKTTGYFDEYVI